MLAKIVVNIGPLRIHLRIRAELDQIALYLIMLGYAPD
jgi:hypothetical protein